MTTSTTDHDHLHIRATFREWWNRIRQIRTKAIVYTVVIVTLLMASFEVQVTRLNAQQFDKLCDQKIKGRNDLRDSLFKIVDLSDLFPGDPTAEAYTNTRVEYINEHYEVIRPGCPDDQFILDPPATT